MEYITSFSTLTERPDMTDISCIFNDILRFKEKYRDETIVIKFGGALAEDDDVIRNIARQAAFLTHSIDANVVIIHGGGKQINNALEEKGITPQRDPKTDLRITDGPTLDVSDSALRTLNGKIVRLFRETSRDICAVGMAGYDGPIVTAEALSHFTGQATGVDTEYLSQVLQVKGRSVIPVIYPICNNDTPQGGESRLNVNADDVAATIAAKLGARRLILCSDIPGVLDKDKMLIKKLNTHEIARLIDNGTVTGGMIAKIKAAADAADTLSSGGVVILDGRKENAILEELLYENGSGTLIHRPGHTKPAPLLALNAPK
jgi:acetylglutamate kinase